ncbi:carboxypeptidase regulatory-like domain-containing protein [Acidobacteria bacterium AB60]|nr:carboxypeptidase regulatory-like domain-containing protein [Acidobacteria bacterium AB60]
MRSKFLPSSLILLGAVVFGAASLLQAQDNTGPQAQNSTVAELVDAPGISARADADVPPPNAGSITGTVTDAYGDIVPGAVVDVDPSNGGARKSQVANDSGYFAVQGLVPNVAYKVTVNAPGFDPWIAPPVTLQAGQYFEVTGIKLKLSAAVTSVTVRSDPLEIATEQVQIEEKQRVLGFVPNFYVVYDSEDAVPLSAKLKFQMAYKVSVDPVSIFGAAFLAAMNQAGDTPNFQQGWKGYGQRFGAAYTDGVTDIMFGGAILPALLHQDPRYFYQGTGSTASRLRHALQNPFVCKGDNGHWQPNYSSMGGDLISSAISNAYYPASNRGAAFTFEGFAVSTGTREISSVLQEFVLRKLTSSSKRP